jgi:hypothetical protein
MVTHKYDVITQCKQGCTSHTHTHCTDIVTLLANVTDVSRILIVLVEETSSCQMFETSPGTSPETSPGC